MNRFYVFLHLWFKVHPQFSVVLSHRLHKLSGEYRSTFELSFYSMYYCEWHKNDFGAREFISCTISLCISWVFARFNLFISALVKIYSCYLQNSIWFVWKVAEMFLICKLKLWICRHQMVLFQSNMLKCNIILSDFVLIFQLFFFIIARLVVLCYLTMFNIIHLTILHTQVRSNNFVMSFIWWQIFVYRALIVLFSHF